MTLAQFQAMQASRRARANKARQEAADRLVAQLLNVSLPFCSRVVAQARGSR